MRLIESEVKLGPGIVLWGLKIKERRKKEKFLMDIKGKRAEILSEQMLLLS